MLRPLLIWAAALAWLGLSACSESPPSAWEPVQTESTYRLLFNDALVAEVLFQLSIEPDGSYRIEAFTAPTGQMRKAGDHQILEVSSGTIADGQIRPTRFDHSVLNGDSVEAVNLLFDWPGKTLTLLGGDERRQVSLQPDTQDRLSYLLAARTLARQGEGERRLHVAASDATEETLLQVIGREELELPLGRIEAVGIRRLSADPGEERELWFADAITPLPLRVVRRRDGNAVEMQLETIVDRVQPASE
jgi:hypothetical protein